MRASNQRGVTLVEVSVALAIASIMFIYAFAQFRSQKQASFSSEIDRIHQKIHDIQAEAMSGVSTSLAAHPGQSNTVIYGKMVEFAGAANSAQARTMRISTLIVHDDAAGGGPALAKCDSSDFQFDQGVEFDNTTSTNQAIVFTFKHGGQPAAMYAATTFAQSLPGGFAACNGIYTPTFGGTSILNTTNLTNSFINPVAIRLTDRTRNARLDVIPAQNTIVRVIN